MPGSEGMTLKALLTLDSTQCFMCADISALASDIYRCNTGGVWDYDLLFFEQQPAAHSAQLQQAPHTVNTHTHAHAHAPGDFEMLRQVRQVEIATMLSPSNLMHVQRLFIIGVVSSTDSAESRACMLAGADACISKPVNLEELKQVMLLYGRARPRSPIIHPRPAACTRSAAGARQDEWGMVGGKVSSLMPDFSGEEDEEASETIDVLVVDDDKGQRTLLKRMLAKEGYHVDTAEDGVFAVEAALRRRYDLILIDGFMPNKTGWDAAVEIFAADAAVGYNPIPIIGLTKNSADEDDRCYAAGMSDVLSKPVARQKLIDKVFFWTNKKKASTKKHEAPQQTPSTTPAPKKGGVLSHAVGQWEKIRQVYI